jgi:hypothetical protein
MDHERDIIRFTIKGPDGLSFGEATGKDLKENEVYRVEMSTGEQFKVRAVRGGGRYRFSWESPRYGKYAEFVPVIGSIIERHFRRKDSERHRLE